MQILKHTFLIVFTIILSALITISVYLAINWHDVVSLAKPVLESSLSDIFNSRLRIDNLKIKMYPRPVLEADGISLDSDQTDNINARISRIYLRIAVMPLFEKKLVVRELEVDSPEFEIIIPENNPAQKNQTTANPPAEQTNVSQPGDASEASGKSESTTNYMLQKLKITAGRINIKKGSKTYLFENFNLGGDFKKIKDNYRLLNTKLSSKINTVNLELDADYIEAGLDSHILLSNAGFELGNFKIRGDGEYNLNTADGGVKLKFSEMQVSGLNKLLKEAGQKPVFLTEGNISGSLDLVKNSVGLLINADFSATGLQSTNSFMLGKTKFGGLNCNIKETDISCKAAIEADGFKFKDKTESYAADKLKSSLVYAGNTKGKTVSGTAVVSGFAFSDGATSITKVNGNFDKINLSIPPNGNVLFKTQLKSSQLELKSGEFSVIKSGEVSAPLEVSIPAKGGYSVKGPVSLKNADMVYSGHKLSSTSGLADIYVSGTGHNYTAKNLSTRLDNVQVMLNSGFDLTKTEYIFKNTKINSGKGEIKLNGVLGRSGNKNAALKLSGQNIDSAFIKALVGEELAQKVYYSIKAVELDLKADKTAFLKTISGTGKAELVSNEIVKNRKTVFERIYEAVSMIPLVGVDVRAESIKPDSNERSAKGVFTAKDGIFNFSEFSLSQLNSFNAKGNGKIDSDGKLDIKVDVIFLEETFTSMGGSFKQLGKLLGRAGRVVIPLKITGVMGDAKVQPDMVELVKNNSGIRLVGSAIGAVGDVGSAIGDVVSWPFRKKEKKQDKDLINPE